VTLDGKTILDELAFDESFDIGIDTRTGVDDSYELPFHFTGKLDTLTYKLGPEQLGENDWLRWPPSVHQPWWLAHRILVALALPP
jgi:hypothetical protein